MTILYCIDPRHNVPQLVDGSIMSDIVSTEECLHKCDKRYRFWGNYEEAKNMLEQNIKGNNVR